MATGGNDHSGQAGGGKFSTVVKAFVEEYVRAGRWTEKTWKENEAVFALYIEIAGDLPVDLIDYQGIRKYKEVLSQVPANRNKIKRYRDKTIPEILSLPNVKPMAVNSVNKNLIRLSQMFKWAVKNGYLKNNVAEGMSLPQPKRQDQFREVFSTEDLNQLFSDPIFTKKRYLHSYYYWLPLLALFTGTPAGKMLFQMLGVFAEFERAMMKERINAGLARARAQGKKLGRPRVSLAVEKKVKALRKEKKGIRKIATELGVGVSTVMRIVA